ncbi:MAG: poly(3-hydroxybutyrate) depolymerase [Rubrivivax sp.]|jgi:polyhydroxybutyrate depolymerase|nr:poly(3-hydroxybutyrate) depolymerase [Rubrivivax sp.]
MTEHRAWRRAKTWIVASVIALLAAGPATAFTAGTHELRLTHAGQERRALVHVPARSLGAPAPLVLALHGGGGHAEFMADDERYGLVSAAERDGYVVAFPNGHSRLPRGRLATWNAGGCCGAARDAASDDLGFLRALVERIAAEHPVDRTRVLAVGMSNGGMMAYRLACEAADLVAGIVAVAGTEAYVDAAACKPSRPVSVLHIHARDDTHVLFGGGAGPDAFRNRSQVMDFVSVPETVSRWRTRLGCRADAEPVLERPGARCERHAGCRGGVELQLCVTDGGGHSWPGAAVVRRGKAPASAALDANERIGALLRTLPR